MCITYLLIFVTIFLYNDLISTSLPCNCPNGMSQMTRSIQECGNGKSEILYICTTLLVHVIRILTDSYTRQVCGSWNNH